MIIIEKLLFAISLLLFSFQIFGQTIMNKYPVGQNSYEGGDVQFYKDFHQILIDKKLKPCENKNEFHVLKLVVYEDASVKYVKDELNADAAIKNKCTFDLSLEVLRYMDKWKPATFDDIKKPTITWFIIFPDALFDKYKEGYLPQNFEERAGFDKKDGLPGGINSFRAEVVRNVDLRGFKWSEPFKLVVTFVVNREGKIEQLKLDESSGNDEFDERILDGIRSIRKRWSPAKIHGEPINYRFRLPLNFSASE
ncbi:energy transducer TonB [Chryseobacterium limigenitum]|uniref:TonB family C-terminal domain-containing protein n=1 Tax=Chryseobacterium limigenitum TaxID=1612149 RepID=A0A1K2ILT6_9FLAO|nr:TonB family protein [Chryseobacterium limigenitum]SFZ93429.1 TonB family C-terminal domain-containing protein [Chryseobacterium limigenitum]